MVSNPLNLPIYKGIIKNKETINMLTYKIEDKLETVQGFLSSNKTYDKNTHEIYQGVFIQISEDKFSPDSYVEVDFESIEISFDNGLTWHKDFEYIDSMIAK